jgi:Protein of unknown function (DUF2934)
MHSDNRSIGELAYHIWRARGCPEGTAEQDWLEAERQMAAMPPNTQPGSTRQSSPAGQSKPTAESPLKGQSTEGVDGSLKDTFPASDPPAIGGPDVPPSNADAKWRAAGVSRTNAPARGAAPAKSRRASTDKRTEKRE